MTLDISLSMSYQQSESANSAEVNSFVELIEAYTEYRNSDMTVSFFNTRKVTKLFKLHIYILIPFLLLYVFGFFFNNFQNPNLLFSSSWFYDTFMLSWTNLLILPILILNIVFSILRRVDWKPDFTEILVLHLLSPILWIVTYLFWRLLIKFGEQVIGGISLFLKFLAE